MAPQSQRDAPHLKPCTLCSTPRSVLVRCQIDTTGVWHFVCPGTCWKQSSVAGGVVDGDGSNPHYRYGGMWKDKKNAVSAKKKQSRKGAARAPLAAWDGGGVKYTRNDVVQCDERGWVCRKGHVSCEADRPDRSEKCWKEADVEETNVLQTDSTHRIDDQTSCK